MMALSQKILANHDLYTTFAKHHPEYQALALETAQACKETAETIEKLERGANHV